MNTLSTASLAQKPQTISIKAQTKTFRENFSQVITDPLHSEETLQRYKDSKLSFMHSALVMLTENLWRTFFSVLTLGGVAGWTKNLIGNHEDQPFFSNRNFLIPISVVIASMPILEKLFKPKAASIETPSISEPENITNDSEKTIAFQNEIIKTILSNISNQLDPKEPPPPGAYKYDFEYNSIDNFYTKLFHHSIGLTTNRYLKYLYPWHKVGENFNTEICYYSKDKKTVYGIRIDCDEITKVQKSNGPHSIHIQTTKKNHNEEDSEFQPFGGEIEVPITGTFALEKILFMSPKEQREKEYQFDNSSYKLTCNLRENIKTLYLLTMETEDKELTKEHVRLQFQSMIKEAHQEYRESRGKVSDKTKYNEVTMYPILFKKLVRAGYLDPVESTVTPKKTMINP